MVRCLSGEQRGRPLAVRNGLAGELRAVERRDDRDRGALRGAIGVVQLGQVAGQGHLAELAASEPSGEPPQACRLGRSAAV